MTATGDPSGRLQVLIVLGDGGHTTEILRLAELIGPRYDFSYVVASDDVLSAQRITIPGPVFPIRRPRAKSDRWWLASWRTVLSLGQALRVCLRVRPDATLGSGPSLMVPVAVATRLLGGKVIFVETGCRVSRLSLTGKVMLRLAHLFFVQWEELQRRHPTTLFAGRLM